MCASMWERAGSVRTVGLPVQARAQRVSHRSGAGGRPPGSTPRPTASPTRLTQVRNKTRNLRKTLHLRNRPAPLPAASSGSPHALTHSGPQFFHPYKKRSPQLGCKPSCNGFDHDPHTKPWDLGDLGAPACSQNRDHAPGPSRNPVEGQECAL